MEARTKLTDAELERLAILAEECAEVQQAISKIIRHGYDKYNPDNDDIPNREHLAKEIGHVRNIVYMMIVAGDVNDSIIAHYHRDKNASIKQWLHYQ